MNEALGLTPLLLMLVLGVSPRWSTGLVSASPELDVFSENPDVSDIDRADREGEEWDAGFFRGGQPIDDAFSGYESPFWSDGNFPWLTGGDGPGRERSDLYGNPDWSAAAQYDPVSDTYDRAGLDHPTAKDQGYLDSYYHAILDVREFNDNSPAVTCHG
ncbi:unnamed protein product, partial [Lymnaea stagnalis]